MERARRLRKGAEFNSVYSQGSVTSGPFFVVRSAPNELGLTRFGFAVGKRVVPSAVDRNRLRRRMRELAREHAPDSSLDIIVAVKKPALELRSRDFAAAFIAAINAAIPVGHS